MSVRLYPPSPNSKTPPTLPLPGVGPGPTNIGEARPDCRKSAGRPGRRGRGPTRLLEGAAAIACGGPTATNSPTAPAPAIALAAAPVATQPSSARPDQLGEARALNRGSFWA